MLRQLGRRSAWAVHGAGGMDELSTLGETQVSRFARTGTVAKRSRPSRPGWNGSRTSMTCAAAAPEDNARTLTGILSGEIGGPRRDIVLLNAAAGFVVAGLADDLGGGRRARAGGHR